MKIVRIKLRSCVGQAVPDSSTVGRGFVPLAEAENSGSRTHPIKNVLKNLAKRRSVSHSLTYVNVWSARGSEKQNLHVGERCERLLDAGPDLAPLQAA